MIRNLFGSMPYSAGRIFWVSPGDSYTVDGGSYAASNDNDGLVDDHEEHPILGLDRARSRPIAGAVRLVVLAHPLNLSGKSPPRASRRPAR